MGRTLTSPLHVARLAMMQDRAWLLFIEIPRVSGGFFRLVRSNRHQNANGYIWQAAGLDIQLPQEDAAGSLGELLISIPNVSRIPMAYVELNGEIKGQVITCWLAKEGEPFAPGLSWRHLALSIKATEQVMSVRCGHPAESAQVPGRRFDRVSFPQLLPQGIQSA